MKLEPSNTTPRRSRIDTKTAWPIWTVVMMIIGYAGYYLCRSHFSVCKPLILEEFKSIGVTKQSLGYVAAYGTAFYAVGKFLFGSMADVFGGRRMFLLGMIGAIVFTFVFGVGGPPIFLFAWIGNRFIQASGWVGMIKITSRWFGHSVYGRVMAYISLSYLFGDFLSRIFLSGLIRAGMGWRSIFYVSATVLAIILVATYVVIRDRPSDRGLPEPPENPESVFATAGGTPEKKRLSEILTPLLSNPTFWVVCVLSFGFTFMRETFNDWTPTYLVESAKMSKDSAGFASSLFPLFGGISVILVGYVSDKAGGPGRALMISLGLLIGTIGLLSLAYLDFTGNSLAVVALVATIGFVLIGPYSLLAGAISLSFGGKQGSATAAGWIDGIGYVGGILSGNLIGSIAEHQGWNPAFKVLALTAGLSCAVSFVYWMRERVKPQVVKVG